MYLDSQNQFREEMIRTANAETLPLEPGYAEAYAEWSEANKEVLYKWSPEERTQRFSDYLYEKVQGDLRTLIEAKPIGEDEKKELATLAKRGQLLLASADGGKTFDQVLAPSKEAVATDYLLLSPTFRSSTTNLQEVVEEQTLIHVVKTLEENFRMQNAAEVELWHVENAYLEQGVVHVEVARSGANLQEADNARFQIEVKVNQDAKLPLVYEHITQKGERKAVLESQLPEEYGEAQEDVSLQMPSTEVLTQVQSQLNLKSTQKSAADAMAAAGLSTWAALEAASHQTSEQRAQAAAELARSNMERPLTAGQTQMVPNITAAKAAMAARFARQNKALGESKKREGERMLKMQEAEKFLSKEMKKGQKKQKKARWNASQKSLAKRTGVVAGLAGGFFGALTGTSYLVTHITLLQ